MKNMTANPAISLAQRARVDCNCVMVLLKLMYLKTYQKKENKILVRRKRQKDVYSILEIIIIKLTHRDTSFLECMTKKHT